MQTADVKRILIVSSDKAFLKKLPDILVQSGYEPFTTSEVITASTEFERVHPHLLILDLGKETEHTLRLLETIRSNPDRRFAQVPVLIGSESGNLMEISCALKLGAKEYFIKSSFDPTDVLKKVQKCFGASGDVAGSPSIKVLMVEDDKFLRELAVQKFTKEGLKTTVAIDGEQAVTLAEKEVPDIILLDILLPGIDGFEALKRMRANPALAKTPVFMLSNFGQAEDIARAKELGVNQFLVKANYTLDEIVAMIRESLAIAKTAT